MPQPSYLTSKHFAARLWKLRRRRCGCAARASLSAHSWSSAPLKQLRNSWRACLWTLRSKVWSRTSQCASPSLTDTGGGTAEHEPSLDSANVRFASLCSGGWVCMEVPTRWHLSSVWFQNAVIWRIKIGEYSLLFTKQREYSLLFTNSSSSSSTSHHLSGFRVCCMISDRRKPSVVSIFQKNSHIVRRMLR